MTTASTPEERAAARAKRRALFEKETSDWSEAEIVAELQERYAPTRIPPCCVCGGELSLQGTGGGGPDSWACSTRETDPDAPGYLRLKAGRGGPGETNPDGHYGRSHYIDYRSGGDELVIEALKRLGARPSSGAYAAIAVERARQLAMGHGSPYDDARNSSDWIASLDLVMENGELAIEEGDGNEAEFWRDLWAKVGSIAVAAIESIDRKKGPSGPGLPPSVIEPSPEALDPWADLVRVGRRVVAALADGLPMPPTLTDEEQAAQDDELAALTVKFVGDLPPRAAAKVRAALAAPAAVLTEPADAR